MNPIEWAKIGGALVLGASIGFGPGFHYGKSYGTSKAEVQATRNAVNRIQEMEKNNASFKDLPAIERCRRIMRSSGLPINECD